jgi:ribosomal protein L21
MEGRIKVYLHKKKKVKQSHYRPGVSQKVTEVKVPRLHDNGTGWR